MVGLLIVLSEIVLDSFISFFGVTHSLICVQPSCPLSADTFFFRCSIPLLLTTPKQSCPTRNLDCANTMCASISCDCWDQPSCSLLLYFCHHAALLHAKAYFSVINTAFGLVAHILSGIVSDKMGRFIRFQVVSCRIRCPRCRPSSRLHKCLSTSNLRVLVPSPTSLLTRSKFSSSAPKCVFG